MRSKLDWKGSLDFKEIWFYMYKNRISVQFSVNLVRPSSPVRIWQPCYLSPIFVHKQSNWREFQDLEFKKFFFLFKMKINMIKWSNYLVKAWLNLDNPMKTNWKKKKKCLTYLNQWILDSKLVFHQKLGIWQNTISIVICIDIPLWVLLINTLRVHVKN